MNNVEMETTILQVPIEDIIPNRFQPRLAFDDASLQDLATSIKQHGIIQPLVLRRNADKYEIIAGERRYKAARMAGLLSVPAIISKMDDNTSAEVAIIENVQRKNLSAIEEAKSYQALLEKGYITQEELAKKMGLSQSSIANKLRLLALDEAVQQAVIEEKISERHARTLLQVNDKEIQKVLLNKIINERLTVKQLDEEIKKMNGTTTNEINVAKPTGLMENNSFTEMLEPVSVINDISEVNNPFSQNHQTVTEAKDNSLETSTNSFINDNNKSSKFFRGNVEIHNSTVSPVNKVEANYPRDYFANLEDAPIVNGPNYNNILSNAVDIDSTALIESNDIIDLEQQQPVNIFSSPEQMPNSFFNYLENQAVNMDVDEPNRNYYIEPPVEEPKADLNNTEGIEMLDDFSISINSNQESNDEYFNEILTTIRNLNLDKNRVTVEEINLPQEYRINIVIKKNTEEPK